MALSSARTDSQYHIYEWPQPIATQSTNNTRPTIVDPALTLIFRMGQGAYGSFFCLKSKPIPHLWMAATDRHSDYQWWKTKNQWHSIDAHIQNGAGSLWLSLWPKEPADTTLKNSRKQSADRLQMMQDQKLLTLRWRSFCHGCIPNILSFNLA